MSFADTYRAEVIASRRDRSRRAFFWAKVTSIVLMLTIAVSLRAEPELRRVLLQAGMDAIAGLSGQRSPEPLIAQKPTSTSLPPSRVKVNRPQARLPQIDPTQMASDVATTLQEMNVRP